MNKIKKFLASLSITALLAGLILTLNACSNESPFNPETEKSEFKVLKVLNPTLQKVFEDSLWVDASGGHLEVGNFWYGKGEITIPPYAVTDSVLIKFWWESTGFLEGGADFSPHGTQFNVPVKIELSYRDADLAGINEEDLEIRYFNEETGEWEFIGNDVNLFIKTVTGYTTHFSRYAIGME